MGKTIGIIIGVVVLIAGAGAGGFYGGTLYERQQAQNVRNAFFAGRGNGGGGGGFGGGVFGTVKTVNGNTIEVTSPQNQTVSTVTLSGSTVVQKTATGAPADIQVGTIITVRGQRDASGNVAATTVQILPPGTTFPNRGGGGGGGGADNGGGANATPQN